MKKATVFIIFLILPFFVFSEKIQKFDNWYVYINRDGSLDFDTFYSDWDKSAKVYRFIYIKAFHAFNGGNESYLGFDRNNQGDEQYFFYNSNSKMEYSVRFSNWNYTDAASNNWQRFTISTEYNRAVQLWNRYLEE
jgi:hypothetical protein